MASFTNPPASRRQERTAHRQASKPQSSPESLPPSWADKPSYIKDKLGSFLFMIKPLFMKDWAMRPPATLTTNGSVLSVSGMAIMSLFQKLFITILQPYFCLKGCMTTYDYSFLKQRHACHS